MKGFLNRFTKKQIVLSMISLISLIIFGVLLLFTNHIKNSLLDQQMAKRWSDKKDCTQITCFFTKGTEVDRFSMLSFENQMKNDLETLNIEATNENSRL